MKGISTPVFLVKFQKGLADRKRLPLAHFIRVLEEVRFMIEEAGREVLVETGINRPDTDFGLELVAGNDGIVFREGSVQVLIAITNHVQAATATAERIIGTIQTLTNMKPSSPTEEIDRQIVRRLNRIAQIQRSDNTELQLVFKYPGEAEHQTGTFGQSAIESALTLQTPIFKVENTSRDRDYIAAFDEAYGSEK